MSDPVQPRSDKRRYWLALPFVVALVAGGILAAVNVLNAGTFGYISGESSLHLVLANMIAQGQFGIAPGEPSAPVASILWPLILAAFSSAPELQYFVPLVLDALALLGTIGLALALLGRMGLYQTSHGHALAAGFMTIAVLLLNVLPLVFLGTGHMAGIFIAMLMLHGLARLLDTGRTPWWLVLTIILAPLMHYGLLIFSIAALIALLFRKRFGIVFASIVIGGALLGGYSVMLTQLGLAPLPPSAFGHLDFSSIHGFLSNAHAHVDSIQGCILAVLCAALLVQMIANRRQPQGVIQLFGVIAIIGYILVGNTGGQYLEHETPILVITAFILLYTHDGFLRRVAETVPPAQTIALIAAIVVVAYARHVPLLIEATEPVAVESSAMEPIEESVAE